MCEGVIAVFVHVLLFNLFNVLWAEEPNGCSGNDVERWKKSQHVVMKVIFDLC